VENAGESKPTGFLGVILPLQRGKKQQRDAPEARVVLNPPRRFKTVHDGHLLVHDHQLEGGVLGGRLLKELQCGGAVARLRQDGAPGREKFPDDEPIGDIVVHHEDAGVAEVAVKLGGRQRRGVGLKPQADGEGEDASPTRFAPYGQLSAHQFHQMPGDGQTQARAAVFPGGGGVGLGELVEDMLHLFRWDADTRIGHGEVKIDLPGGNPLYPFLPGVAGAGAAVGAG